MSRILISGSLAYDRIMDFDGLFGDHILPEKTHELSVSFFVPDLRESFGGNAGNIAYTLSLLGEKPFVVGTAGNDFAPYEAWLTASGIDTTLIRKEPNVRTAFATIMTDRNNNQITAFYPGAMQTPYPLESLLITKTDFLILAPSNPETMRELPERCRRRAVPFLFDPGQQIPILSADDLKNGIDGARVIIVNDYELELIREKTSWDEAEMTNHAELVVVTLGEKGSRVHSKGATFSTPAAKPRAVVDPTGAGDAYRAGFVLGLLKHLPLETCAKLAGVVACYTVETEGTQTHTFTKEELVERYRENFNETLHL